jgi:hypothetical protein
MDLMYPHLSDVRPMGVNNLNQLVHYQIGSESYAVVHQVYLHLQMLKSLSDNLPHITKLGSNVNKLEFFQQYLGTIVTLAENVNALVKLADNVPFLSQIAPRVNQFVENQQKIQYELETQKVVFNDALALMETNIKNVEDLFVQYERCMQENLEYHRSTLANDYKEYSTRLTAVVEDMESIARVTKINASKYEEVSNRVDAVEPALLELKATVAVTKAIYSDCPKARRKAVKAIEASEKAGNDESINRDRLRHGGDMSVMSNLSEGA